MRRTLLAAAITLLTVVVVAVVLLRPQHHDRSDGLLRVYNPTGNRAKESQGSLRAGVPYTFATNVALCTTGAPVTITGVKLLGAHDLQLIDWALWKTYGWEDLLPGSAYHSVYAIHPRLVVSDPCTYHGAMQMLAVSMSFSGSRGSVVAFEVHSTDGTAVITFPIAACATDDCPLVRTYDYHDA